MPSPPLRNPHAIEHVMPGRLWAPELGPVYVVKRNFVQRKAMHKFKGDEAERVDGPALEARLEALIGGHVGLPMGLRFGGGANLHLYRYPSAACPL